MTLARFACEIPFALLVSACTPNTTSAPASEPGAPAPLSAEGDFGATLQGALINAKPGDTIVMPAGTFALADSLSLDVEGVTLRGAGQGGPVLDFAQQSGAG